MSEFAQIETAELSAQEKSIIAELRDRSVKVRVSPNNYFVALFLATFFTGLLAYLEYNAAAIGLFSFAWVFIPFFIWTDRISFDGEKLTRTGFVPRIWAWLNNSRIKMKLDEIEQVETQAIRAVKRGGKVFYRYKTQLCVKDLQFVVSSGGGAYRQMVKKLLPFLSENILDNRSIELRDYINEPEDTLMKAEFARIPSTEVLETSVNEFQLADRTLKLARKKKEAKSADLEKADYLRTLGNELRLSGNLLQALEAFRRALAISPKNSWLLFEFARCLHSFAGAEKNAKLEKKALAVLRLAEQRADSGDDELFSRLGESYFQYGDWSRARKAFLKAIDSAEASFRSIRGLAEISLREGKIAHVIHHFATANRMAETPALRRWTQSETEYFSKLNEDDDYMEMELSRVNLLESLERGKKTSLKIALIALPVIIFGLILNEALIVNIGWAVSSVSFLIWVGIIMSRNLLSTRVPLDFE
ncbi:MAG: tetratricopeptide repeat protein [Pyrinomonadaceae bacterium]|nr:tetratricopeptide repeat protein [Pyrinomonadaceae bacterium]